MTAEHTLSVPAAAAISLEARRPVVAVTGADRCLADIDKDATKHLAVPLEL